MKEEKIPFKCGIVSIIGRPNVGKSTLLNKILEEKVSIVSKVPQTTRQKIRGIYNAAQGQIIFIDTPGLHHQRDKLDALMNLNSWGAIGDADCLIHLVDANSPVGREEEEIVQKLQDFKGPIVLGLNKIDLKGKCVEQYLSLYEKGSGKSIHDLDALIVVPLSGKTGFNIELLLKLLWERLPEGPALYPQDSICDIPQKMAVADIIREKLLGLLREELPHAIGVAVEQLQPRRDNLIYVQASILVERESQKEIVIGKKGQILKEAGALARQELEALLDSKVYLDLHVKAEKKWRDNAFLLEEMGYNA